MSSFNLKKKLKPASKAWKSLTKTFRSKLESLHISPALKKTTHCVAKSLKSIRCHRHRHIRRSSNHCVSYSHLQMKSAAIYVDELYGPTPKTSTKPSYPSTRAKTKIKIKTMTHNQKEPAIDDVAVLKESRKNNPKTLADAWNNIAISPLPKLPQNIDEKAEEFISKFREDMKMQKEKSILEFQDMLARSC